MRFGIQYQKELQIDKVREAGFSYMEVPYEELQTADTVSASSAMKVGTTVGLLLKAKGLTTDKLQDALLKAKEYQAEYIVLDTQELTDAEELYQAVSGCVELIQTLTVEIYFENGYRYLKDGGYGNCIFSEAGELVRLVEELNTLCDKKCFGVCLNVGYGNLVGKNMRVMVEKLGPYLKLLHASDNDGIHNWHQLPYTFTTGRGARSTDWYHILGAMIKGGFDGWIVFDTIGLFKRTPLKLQGAMLKFLVQISEEWREAFEIEKLLNQPDKKLLLFGAGKMMINYYKAWGRTYPPAFLVDNNSAIWGEERLGFEIKSPEAILEIPPEERNVWICNMAYDSIGQQLTEMGVEYHCYWDHYYLMDGV